LGSQLQDFAHFVGNVQPQAGLQRQVVVSLPFSAEQLSTSASAAQPAFLFDEQSLYQSAAQCDHRYDTLGTHIATKSIYSRLSLLHIPTNEDQSEIPAFSIPEHFAGITQLPALAKFLVEPAMR
jgi:hypothetical protein